MECSFTIDFTGTAETVVDNIKTKVLANEGTFSGDNASGNFTVATPVGRIDGNYNIVSQQITIEITHKPFFLSCGQIESYVTGNLITA